MFTVNDLVFGFWGLGFWELGFGDDDLWGLVKQTIRFLILYDILYQSSFSVYYSSTESHLLSKHESFEPASRVD